jgi:hypothetical protein
MASLGIDRIKTLLNSYAFFPQYILVLEKKPLYINVISAKSGRSFMICIPEDYNLEVNSKSSIETIEIKPVSYLEKQSVTHRYANEPDPSRLESIYPIYPNTNKGKGKGTPVEDEKAEDENKIEDKLLETYKQPIFNEDVTFEDTNTIKELFRQLRRFRYSIQNTEFRFSSHTGKYVCFLEDSFSIKGYGMKTSKESQLLKLYTVVNLEYFVEEIENMEDAIEKVEHGFQSIIDKNLLYNSEKYNTIAQKAPLIFSYTQQINSKLESKKNELEELEQNLIEIREKESELKTSLATYNASRDVFLDYTKIQRRQTLEKELIKVQQEKTFTIEDILKLRDSYMNTLLRTDKILFDNIVMTDTMINNIKQIASLAKT